MFVQFIAGHRAGEDLRVRPWAETSVGPDKCQFELARGAACWNQHDGFGVPDSGFGVLGTGFGVLGTGFGVRERQNRAAEGVQIGNADETRLARSNHLSCGRRSSDWISVRAFAPSINAPAAADEASHARVMSPAIVASRRIDAALLAS